MQEFKITIPIEIVNASKIDFSKPLYLYWQTNDLLVLSNKKRRKYCFGQISVDKEYTFILTQNTIKASLKYSQHEMFVRSGEIYICSCSYSNPKINSRFTIPKEILKICTINFEKPVYLCMDQYECNRYYLSNQQDTINCIGLITLDENHSFYLTSNICKALRIPSAENISVYVSDNKIYFHIYD